MQHEEFNKIVEDALTKTKEVLISKSKEYSSEEDKLHNFKRAGILSSQIPEKALLGMAVKHHVSILDIVDKLENNVLPTQEMLDEKIGDYINYMLLLKACIMERISNKEKETTKTPTN